MSEDTQKKKNWFVRHKVITGIMVLVILSVIGNNTTKNSSSQPQQSSQETSANTTPASPVAEQEKPKSYQQVFQLKGNGTKKSEPFTITGDHFKIAYDCKGSYCGAYLHKTDSSFPQVIMNVAGSTKDETIVYASGEYYIEANAIGSYTMTVFDYK